MDKHDMGVSLYPLALIILHFGAPAIWFVCAAKLFTIKLKLVEE